MNLRTHRTKFLTGIAATGLALASTIGPSYAQSAPAMTGSWLAGPDGKGSSTIVGRIETPRAGASANNASNLLVSGWAADMTATGWAGIDGVEVWNGASDKSGSAKLATGTVGLPRADVTDSLGSNFTNSGFTAVVKSGALQGLTGAQTLFVYLHTPGKGTWYKTQSVNVISTVGVNAATGVTSAFPNDPILVIARPQEGMAISQKQRNNKFSFNGFALDRNPITDPKIQTPGSGCNACMGATDYLTGGTQGAGVSYITAYVDAPPVKGDVTTFGLFGAPCAGSACMYASILTDNGVHSSVNVPGRPFPSIITRQYGSQFDFSGWSIPIDPAVLSVGPHILYVTATSSVTGSLDATGKFVGKTTSSQVDFNIVNTAAITPDPLLCTGNSKANHMNSNC